MPTLFYKALRPLTALSAFVASCAAVFAQDAALEQRLSALEAATANSAYVDNSYLFLIGGIIVMFMAAGFCCLEVGLVRSKNAAMQSTKNVALFSISGLMFWIIGYNIAYPSEWIADEWLGKPAMNAFFWSAGNPAEASGPYAPASDWFFQMVFVATAASIVSGTVAERVKLWPFLIFTAVLTSVIYPVVASWEWGTGALDDMGFSDFAGSTLVHSTGGWAALIGAIIIGPRAGKYVGKRVNPMPGSNIPMAALGTFILWFGWFGFNGASELAAAANADDGSVHINNVAQIFANTNMAAVGGVISAMILTSLLYKGKIDATMVFNGAIGGLVSITAEPLAPSMGASLIIGAIGGMLVVVTVPLLDRFKIDDVVGAIPAHLVCGIWGTMIVPFSNSSASYSVQAIGVVATGIFVCSASAIVWGLLKVTVGVRVNEEGEQMGLDKAEVGLEAYPEFAS